MKTDTSVDATATLVSVLKYLRESMWLRLRPHTEGDIAVNVTILTAWASAVDEAIAALQAQSPVAREAGSAPLSGSSTRGKA